MSEAGATVVIDFPATPRRVFAKPAAVLEARTLDEVRDVIRAAEAAARAGSYAAGFISYEAAPAFDAALRVRSGARMPLAWFGVFPSYTSSLPAAPRASEPPHWRIADDAGRFMETVEHIREEIASGRTYQVNLTTSLSAEFAGDALALYESLRRAQGSGYHACIDTGRFTIVSASPELFFDLRDRHIRTRPMKGTRRRGRFVEEDAALRAELAASEKDRAENLMIVDLLRNDLGRVARTGSVEVTSLYDIEQYRTVHQMVSVIEADLRADVSLVDVFAALFPCGSVTGAPKVSTMELITQLEAGPREVYCGAIGVIEPGGDATFSVPIRTVWIDWAARRATYGTGAGITFDSDAHAEYAEVRAKAAVLEEAWPDFELLETMRIERGRIVRRERHIHRLLASARYFGIAVSRVAIDGALRTAEGGSGRLRLLVDQTGATRAELQPLEAVERPRVALARRPISSQNRFLFHKTTNRSIYDEHQEPGFWDVLLWNEREEITEFTRGNVVVELAGALLTPVRECGLLGGVFRQELLEGGAIEEAVIGVADLVRVTRVWFINSLREWVEVTGPAFGFRERPPSKSV